MSRFKAMIVAMDLLLLGLSAAVPALARNAPQTVTASGPVAIASSPRVASGETPAAATVTLAAVVADDWPWYLLGFVLLLALGQVAGRLAGQPVTDPNKSLIAQAVAPSAVAVHHSLLPRADGRRVVTDGAGSGHRVSAI